MKNWSNTEGGLLSVQSNVQRKQPYTQLFTEQDGRVGSDSDEFSDNDCNSNLPENYFNVIVGEVSGHGCWGDSGHVLHDGNAVL